MALFFIFCECMNSDDLKCFARVAHCGSISRAALELGSDQSTVSRQMARLEAAAQTRLLHRSGRGVLPTEAGLALLDYASRVADTLDEARRVIHSFSEQGPAQVVIAAQPTIARSVFGPVSKALKAQFPKTKLRFVEGLGTHMLSWLAAGDIDMAVFYLPTHAHGLKVDVVLREDVRLVAPPDHMHIGSEFSVRHLGEVPLILPSTPHGLRLLAESLAEKAGITLNVAVECDASTSVTKRMVLAGSGCTILPLAAVAEEVAQGRLRTARLVDPEVTREVAITTSSNRPAVLELWDMTRIIRQEITAIVNSGGWPGAQLLD